MTEIRKVELKAVAAEELRAITDKELEIGDPENAREIVELCGKDCGNTCKNS